ncbi:MAG: hypothetical protein V4725_01285 [Bacteroidota bacterium]|nr:hypothetical protein [Ferruginibacter sp.]
MRLSPNSGMIFYTPYGTTVLLTTKFSVMLQNMLGNRKSGGGLLLAGLAAFAWYKYSKMSPDQKTKLTSNLKEQGKKILGQVMPGMNTRGTTTNESNVYSGGGM